MASPTVAPSERTPAGRRAQRSRLRPGRIAVFIFLSLITVAVLFPIAYVFNESLISAAGLRNGTLLAIPPSLDSLSEVWRRSGMPLSFINSLIYSSGSVIALWVVGSMAAYAGTKLKMKGRNALLFGIVLFLALPFQTILYPLFAQIKDLGWVNERYGLIVVMTAFGLPVTIFQFAAYFRSLPNEVVEAAKIDGASALRTLFQVILPMSMPVLAITGVLNAIWTWNAIYLPLILITKRDNQTMVVTLAQLVGESGVTNTTAASIAVLGMLPMVIFFLIAQRTIIKGMASGAVRG